MNKIAVAVTIMVLASCNNTKKQKYKELHDKYRTFWYRTGEPCFYDSSKKYGELYSIEIGNTYNVNYVDTVTINEPPPICK